MQSSEYSEPSVSFFSRFQRYCRNGASQQRRFFRSKIDLRVRSAETGDRRWNEFIRRKSFVQMLGATPTALHSEAIRAVSVVSPVSPVWHQVIVYRPTMPSARKTKINIVCFCERPIEIKWYLLIEQHLGIVSSVLICTWFVLTIYLQYIKAPAGENHCIDLPDTRIATEIKRWYSPTAHTTLRCRVYDALLCALHFHH